jgi:hypothetical protein
VPDEVIERLQRLAARDGTSVAAMAVRELTEITRRTDNAALLGALPDLGVDPVALVAGVDAERASGLRVRTPPIPVFSPGRRRP